MIRRVAVLPHPPLIVPELTGAGDRDAAAVRAACLGIVRGLGPRWFVLGADRVPGRYGPEVAGTFRGFGVDVRVGLGPAADPTFADPALPLPALVAGWLRGEVGAQEATVRVIPADLSPAGCVAEGERMATELSGPDPVDLLVLGDGSHRHGERAVGRPDDRADAFDADIAAALAAVDVDRLSAIDPDLAAELGAVGRAPWQVLAEVVRAVGGRWQATESSMSTPFGVAYHFAVWTAA
ncbi:hypothetical protein [Actinokineospora enzanensis]|uniref:hypothetical protein n=1 Tax=Actinokineospora enzanensis TaxID=155975 RepID=UPI0003607F8A|nr:hypothetical protein [Actinokineospora enzanensis]